MSALLPVLKNNLNDGYFPLNSLFNILFQTENRSPISFLKKWNQGSARKLNYGNIFIIYTFVFI